MDHPSRLRENLGGWGNRYDRGCARDRGEYRQHNRGSGNPRYENQWINRDNYRQDINRTYNQEERPQRGYGRPSYQGPNVYHQENRAEAPSLNNFNDSARPKDKNHEDHIRDARQDRWRTLEDKNVEVGARDSWREQFGSPDRSLPEHCIQDTLSLSADAITQNQSKQVIRANQGQTSELLQLAKVGKEKNVKSTMRNEGEEDVPNSSDFVYDLEDSTSSSCPVREDALGQRLEFGEVVKVGKVPIGGANLVQDGKGKKKKNKKNKGDREKKEGTKTQRKTGVDITRGSEAPNTPSDSWEDEEKFVDVGVQDQESEEEYVDAHVAADSFDVKVESFAEHLPKNCKSASNLHTASSYPSLNNTLQQEFDETRQMARQCTTQKSQEEQCQVIAVVKHESVDFPDGRRYTCTRVSSTYANI